MQKILIFFIVISLAIPLIAEDRNIEVSEDGWQMVVLDKNQNDQNMSFTTDEVPFNATPDWSCNLRMQVGGLSMADLDDDGDLDLVVGCYHSQSYPPYNDWRNFILYNNNGELEASPSWWSDDSSSTTEVCTADFNGDGHPDIFAGNGDFSFDPSRIYFHRETDDSIWTHADWSSSDNSWTTGAAVFDFDQDGDIDIATSNQGVNPDPYRPVYIFVNHSGSVENFPSWSSSELEISGSVSWGDYDHDGWYDLAVSKWADFYSCVYHNVEGSVNIYPSWYANNDNTQKGVAWGDVNGDDYPELAIGGNGLANQLYPNNEGTLGTAPVWESNNSFHGVQDIGWADVDNDGDPDLATVNFSNGQLRIYLNIDGVLESTPSWIYDATQVGTALTFGDINGDGLVDLVMGVSGQPCVMVFYNTGATGINEQHNLPVATALLANYPNPFNAQTRIFFNLKKDSEVKLIIYDISGRQVKTLVNNRCAAGHNSVIWDGKDSRGSGVASGVYFYRLETNAGAQTQKMVMLK